MEKRIPCVVLVALLMSISHIKGVPKNAILYYMKCVSSMYVLLDRV